MYNNVLLVYFSGTGGTKRIADSFYEKLLNKELNIVKHSLEAHEYESIKDKYPEIVNKVDLVILIYPVYAVSAPIAVYNWIRDLPLGKNTSAVVISVSGGGDVWPNRSCRVNAIKDLERKNYKVIYEKMLVMPANIFVSINDSLAMHLINCVPERVDRIIRDILSGKVRRDGIHLSTHLLTLIHTEKELKKFANYYKTNDKCTMCSWCVKNCPFDNISIDNNTVKFGDKCNGCFRCIYGCPNKAIYLEKGNPFVVKKGFDIKEVEKRMCNQPLEPVEKCCKGLAMIGVRKYLLEKN